MRITTLLAVAAASVAAVSLDDSATSSSAVQAEVQADASLGLALLTRRSSVLSRASETAEIPLTLLFNHKRNLMKLSDEDLASDQQTSLLRQNVRHTIDSFRGAGEPKVFFWDNAECAQGLRSLEQFGGSELAKDFESEPAGMVKSDLCRLAMLYLYGGYYFDTDILPVVPMYDHLGKDTTFATVVATDGDNLFQAFMAASPRHPLIAEALRTFRSWYRGDLQSGTAGGNVGTVLLKQAFTDWSGEAVANRVVHRHGHVSRFFTEGKIDSLKQKFSGLLQGSSEGLCNYAVVDGSTQTLLMYSRVYDSRAHVACKEEAQLLGTLGK